MIREDEALGSYGAQEKWRGPNGRFGPRPWRGRSLLLSCGVIVQACWRRAPAPDARHRFVVTASKAGPAALVLAWGILVSTVCPAREVVDMLGRRVTLPDTITRVYSTAPPTTLIVYAMKPETLIGWNFAHGLSEKDAGTFLDVHTVSLPVLGNMMGHGQQADLEEILAMKPDLVVAWTNAFLDSQIINRRFAKSGIPVVFLRLEELPDYAAAFVLMGDVLNEPERGALLAGYVRRSLERVQAVVEGIRPFERVWVYYAESPDGLATDCDRSLHTEAIRRAGGANVYRCNQGTLVGMEKVTLEQVVHFAPDFILALDPGFARSIAGDPRWRNVEAVAAGRVRVVPRLPFNWVDRPPSFMQALGIQWLANLLYPKLLPIDIAAETRHFYKLFLNVDLTDADVARLLQ
jgi:iron complex transport system substrate-binding protein